MPFPSVARYADLVKGIISGSFYESAGIVLPYRSEQTRLRIETSEANTKFYLYLNEIFSGEEISDSEGNITCDRLLPIGEIEVTLLSNASGRTVRSYVTVREYALWLASYAESLEIVDANIDIVRDNLSISTADLSTLNDYYGNQFGFYSNIGQGTEAYRNQVQELRSSFRDFGGCWKGLEEAVAEVTQVTPFGYTRRNWGPNWTLDGNLLVNHRFDQRSCQVTQSSFTVPGVTVVAVEADMPSSYATNLLSASYDFLAWRPNSLANYKYVRPSDGLNFLPGFDDLTPTYVVSRSVKHFSIDSSGPLKSDKLYLNIDSRGEIVVTLTTGGSSPDASEIVTDINAALAADSRYVTHYSTAASTYGDCVLIQGRAPYILTTVPGVEILHGPDNAAAEVFGTLPGDITFPNPILPGVDATLLTVNSYAFNTYVDTCIISHTYNSALAKPHGFAFYPNGYILGSYVYVDGPGEITLTDFMGLQSLTVYITYEDLNTTASETATFSIGYSRKGSFRYNKRGLWVDVDMPVLAAHTGVHSDAVVVYDDLTAGYVELPDGWSFGAAGPGNSSVILRSDVNFSTGTTYEDYLAAKLETYPTEPHFDHSPTSAFKLNIAGSGRILELIGKVNEFPLDMSTPRGQNFPQKKNGGIYDYEGYPVKMSAYFRNVLANAVKVDLSFSFDGGSTWVVNAAPKTIVVDSLAYLPMTYAEFETIIPAATTEVLVKYTFTPDAGNIRVEIDSPYVGVRYITSQYLGNATVVRSNHRNNFGELLWVWNTEPFSTKEKQYLGLPHIMATPNAPIGGVEITAISASTPTGNGTLEYEYNSTGSKKLRWIPNGLTWTPGVGWISITSDSPYTLYAPDNSYILIQAIYENVPKLTGTMPVLRTRTILISDASTNPGLPQRISPARSTLDIYDNTEFDADLVPLNLVGTITETDLSYCGLVNSIVSVADPFKYSYISPQYSSQAGEVLTLAVNGGNYEALLAYPCNLDQVEACLYADGIPIPNDMWSFYSHPSGYTYVRIPTSWFPATLSTTSVYTIDYDLLYQVTTPYLDLLSTYQDYNWYADYFLWERFDKTLGEYDAETPIYFNVENGRAYLARKSTANISLAKLIVQTATDQLEVPKSSWRFIDSNTVEVDKTYLTNGQYYLTHQEKRVYEESRLTTTFEHRSANTVNNCAIATWYPIERNECIEVHQITNPHRYHQLRISISGIRDLRDFRLRSMFFKGLNLYSRTSFVNGLTNVWLGAPYVPYIPPS